MNLEDAFGDQLDDYLVGRVWIDFQGFAEFANRRKRITWTHLAGDHGFFGGVDDLLVEGEAGFERDAEGDHLCIMTASTVKGKGYVEILFSKAVSAAASCDKRVDERDAGTVMRGRWILFVALFAFVASASKAQTKPSTAAMDAGQELSLKWPSGSVSWLIPLSADHFMDRSYWVDVKIQRDVSGRPAGLIYDRFRGVDSAGK
jgi:hypothetical protein